MGPAARHLRRPRQQLDYAGVCLQARRVGGDYFDFLDYDHGRLGLVIGDVSGKGLGAALLMANLQAHVRGQYLLHGDDLPAMLANAAGEEFGGARLAAVLRDAHAPSAEAALDRAVAAVKEFSHADLADDVTIVVARCH